MINLTLNITINLKDKDKVEVLLDKPEEEKVEDQNKYLETIPDEVSSTEIYFPETEDQTINWPTERNYDSFMALASRIPKITFAGAFKAHLWKILWNNGIVSGEEDFVESFNSGDLKIGITALYGFINRNVATMTSWWEAIIWRDSNRRLGVMPIECRGKKYLLQIRRYYRKYSNDSALW